VGSVVGRGVAMMSMVLLVVGVAIVEARFGECDDNFNDHPNSSSSSVICYGAL
jgi:hypothetical protein